MQTTIKVAKCNIHCKASHLYNNYIYIKVDKVLYLLVVDEFGKQFGLRIVANYQTKQSPIETFLITFYPTGRNNFLNALLYLQILRFYEFN